MRQLLRQCRIFRYGILVVLLLGLYELVRPPMIVDDGDFATVSRQVITKAPIIASKVESSNIRTTTTKEDEAKTKRNEVAPSPFPTASPVDLPNHKSETETLYPVTDPTAMPTRSDSNNKTTMLDFYEDTIATARSVAIDGQVIIQYLLNGDLLNLTKNWVCNVRTFGILDRVVFVSTEKEVADGLKSFNSTLNIFYVEGFNYANSSRVFRERAYRHFVHFRTKLVLDLLLVGITVWITEPSALWLQNPSERLASFNGDMLVMNDRPFSFSEYIHFGAFRSIRPSLPMQKVYKKLDIMMARHFWKEEAPFNFWNLNERLLFDSVAQNVSGFKLTSLPQDEFLSGMLYSEGRERFPNAQIINNNWLDSAEEKKERAKKFGDWFLVEDGSVCDASIELSSTATVQGNSTSPLNKARSQSKMKVSSLEDVIARAKSIAGDTHVILQLLTAGYLELTMNWVCNVESLGILDKVLFVATDSEAADGLITFNPELQVSLLPVFELITYFEYENVAFRFYMSFRTRLIYQMLMADITVWLTEPDTVWLEDPSDRLASIDGEILVLNNLISPYKEYCGGFQYLRPTKGTKSVYEKSLRAMERQTHKPTVKKILAVAHDYKDLQYVAADLKINLTYLPEDEFMSGLLYSVSREFYPNATVIHNNFVPSTKRKILRAKQMGDWFLTDNGSICNTTRVRSKLERNSTVLYIPRTPSKVNVSSAEDIITKAQSIAGDSHVIIQLLSAGYLELTKNWVCNVGAFGILDKVLFITTDSDAADGLVTFDPSLQVAYIPGFERKTTFGFHDVQYKMYMDFRTQLIYNMLDSNITVWLTESDAVWLRDPSDRLMNLDVDSDILVLNDQILPLTQYCGGFQYLRPTPSTKFVWESTRLAMIRNLWSRDIKEIMDGANEQNHLHFYASKVNTTFLPQDEFKAGLFYMIPRSQYPNASVIHNNWVEGIAEKVRRAKEMDDWFLTDDGSMCNATRVESLSLT